MSKEKENFNCCFKIWCDEGNESFHEFLNVLSCTTWKKSYLVSHCETDQKTPYVLVHIYATLKDYEILCKVIRKSCKFETNVKSYVETNVHMLQAETRFGESAGVTSTDEVKS